MFKGVLVHLRWAILDQKPPSIPLVWVGANKWIWLNLVPAWRPRSAVGGCGLNEGHGVGSSHNKGKANSMCAQDLSNARDVDAPVAGSLRVRQPYRDKDEGQEADSKVGMSSGQMRSGEQGIATKRSRWRVGGKSRVDTGDGAAESKMNVNCCVKGQN